MHMVSLKPLSNQPKDVLKHVFLCLGKETIPFQDLVFFMAFDLKLFPPSECEKTLDAARKEGLIDIAADKMVTINSRLLMQKPLLAGKEVPVNDIVNALAASIAEIDKAVAIKHDRLISCSADAKTGILTINFSGDAQGKTISITINPGKKILYQEYDDDVSAFGSKHVLLKFALRAVMLRKDDKATLDIFRDVLANVNAWKFTYKRA
jgi:hypothetical protein